MHHKCGVSDSDGEERYLLQSAEDDGLCASRRRSKAQLLKRRRILHRREHEDRKAEFAPASDRQSDYSVHILNK